MVPAVIGALPIAALPFACAGGLALIASWRVGTLVNALGTSVLFVLVTTLPWTPIRIERVAFLLLLLTTFVAMVTSWLGYRDIAIALGDRSLGRAEVRRYHVGCQALLGAIVFALAAPAPELSWLGLAIAVGAAAVITGAAGGGTEPASRLLLLCGAGLMLALLGIVLLGVAPGTGSVCLVLGYGAVAGLAPWHGWVAGAAAEAPAAGGVMVTALMVNVPLLAFMRLQTTLAPGLLMALGLGSLLVGGALLFSRADVRQTVAFSGTAQLGMVVYAIGLGGAIAPVDIALLTLTRAAALHGRGAAPGLLALALLPLFTLFLLAGPTAAYSAWLLLPLGVGALLTCWGVFASWPAGQPTREDPLMLAPLWLELALVAVLAFASPPPVADWLGAMAVVR